MNGGVLFTIYLQTAEDFNENDSMQFNKKGHVFVTFTESFYRNMGIF